MRHGEVDRPAGPRASLGRRNIAPRPSHAAMGRRDARNKASLRASKHAKVYARILPRCQLVMKVSSICDRIHMARLDG